MPGRHVVFGFLALVIIVTSSYAEKSLSRLVQRDVFDQIRKAPTTTVESGPRKRADIAAKLYLDKLQARYATILDHPWDTRYTNHMNVRQWTKS